MAFAVPEEIKEVDFINDYHAYCRLCQHHFYSCSKLSDIDSFFQTHLNSFTHVQSSQKTSFNKDKSPIVWKKWLYTGFCNICLVSDIEAFIIYTESDIINIIKKHTQGTKHIKRVHQTKNYGVQNLFQILDFFAQLCIFRISKKHYSCELCGVKISNEHLIDEHLSSQEHYTILNLLVYSKFNITLNEIKNISHMNELLIELKKNAIFRTEESNPPRGEVVYENSTCLSQIMLNFSHEYKSFTMDDLGFSPKLIEKEFLIKDEDFLYLNNKLHCRLCNEACINMDKHFASNSHQMRVMIFKQCLSVGPVSNIEYLTNCVKRLFNIRTGMIKYNIVKGFLEQQGLAYGLCFTPEYCNADFDIEKIKKSRPYQFDVGTENRVHEKENKVKDKGTSGGPKMPDSVGKKKKKTSSKNNPTLRDQLSEIVHSLKQNSDAKLFLCMVCFTYGNVDQAMLHVENEFHVGNKKLLQNAKGNTKITCHFCSVCNILIVGLISMIELHSSFTHHQFKSSSRASYPKELKIAAGHTRVIHLLLNKDRLMNLIETLIKEADFLTQYPINDFENVICTSLQSIVSKIYPSCKCFIFGSRVTGLILDSSDMDIFIDCHDLYLGESYQSQSDQADFVRKVSKALKNSRQFSRVIAVTKCRVPIVKCFHRSTGIECDISFKNGLSCENTRLIKFMISLDSRIRGLILFIKYWMKRNELLYRPNFSSYALNLLIFYYLQQEPNPILPTVEYLQDCYTGPPKIIGEWNCGFSTDMDRIPKTKNDKSIIELLIGFFNFCSTFDFKTYVISPLTGKPLDRELFQSKEFCLPNPYMRQIHKIDQNAYPKKDTICIMDPFDLNYNVTKGFPSDSFNLFLYFSRISAKLLSESYDPNSLLTRMIRVTSPTQVPSKKERGKLKK